MHLRRVAVVVGITAALIVPFAQPAFAHQHCGTPQAEPDCPEFQKPTPTPKPHKGYPSPTAIPPTSTTVPPTVVPPTYTPTTVPSQPQSQPTLVLPVTTSSSPGGHSSETICVVSYGPNNEYIRVDSRPVTDANAWLAVHPLDYRMPQGGDCGPTVTYPSRPTATPLAPIPTATPAAVEQAPVIETVGVETTPPPLAPSPQPQPQPCWATDADTGEILYAEDGTPVPCTVAPVEVQPAPEVPAQLPDTGDPHATDACVTSTDPAWWQFIGAFICG